MQNNFTESQDSGDEIGDNIEDAGMPTPASPSSRNDEPQPSTSADIFTTPTALVQTTSTPAVSPMQTMSTPAASPVQTTSKSTSVSAETTQAKQLAGAPPGKKRRAGGAENSKEIELIGNANEMLAAIKQKMNDRSRNAVSGATSASRRFCDWLSGELESIHDPTEREELQFKLHATVMQHKHPNMFANTPGFPRDPLNSSYNVPKSTLDNAAFRPSCDYYPQQYTTVSNQPSTDRFSDESSQATSEMPSTVEATIISAHSALDLLYDDSSSFLNL